MMFDLQIFKKLVKEAYQGYGLHIRREEGEYQLAGRYWYLSVKIDCFPNKARAAVIELVGEFPKENEEFIARDKEDKTYEGCFNNWDNITKEMPKQEILYYATKVMVENKDSVYRVWKSIMRKNALLIQERFTDFCSNDNIIKRSETEPAGPFLWHWYSGHAAMVCWVNNACKFMTLTREEPTNDMEEKTFLTILDEIELPSLV